MRYRLFSPESSLTWHRLSTTLTLIGGDFAESQLIADSHLDWAHARPSLFLKETHKNTSGINNPNTRWNQVRLSIADSHLDSVEVRLVADDSHLDSVEVRFVADDYHLDFVKVNKFQVDM